MSTTAENIEIAKLSLELLQLCAKDDSSAKYEAFNPDLRYNAPFGEAFNAIYAHLSTLLIEK